MITNKGTPKRVVVWFSCGAASAVCADIALRKYRGRVPVVLAYTDPGTYSVGRIGEHPDNKRFLADCEKWLDYPVTVLKSEKYDNPADVFLDKGIIKMGRTGYAPCTVELKKALRHKFQDITDAQVFGFTADESDRAEGFRKNNPEVDLWTPLIERMISKADCLAYVKEAGIELPVMYRQGYRNNNCIGCVKGGIGYWNKIRKDYADVYKAAGVLEREVGAAINVTRVGGLRKPMYLDEMPEGIGNYESEPDIECGLLCQMAIQEEFCE